MCNVSFDVMYRNEHVKAQVHVTVLATAYANVNVGVHVHVGVQVRVHVPMYSDILSFYTMYASYALLL